MSGIPGEIVREHFTKTGASATLVAGITGKKIRVLSLYLTCGTNSVTITLSSDDTNDLSGPVREASVIPLNLAYSHVGHFETNAGEGLKLTHSISATSAGSITYVAY